jgi:phosphoribosylaminoimidazolecarboxamide formyltransferase/IMP cyclohydrolase
MEKVNQVLVQRALLSVSDKEGLIPLATRLRTFGVELLATGGTYGMIKEAGLEVREVADVTDWPEMMGGRVKTLHPRIHGGLLARTSIDDSALIKHQIPAIDLLVLNLYPFEAVAANEDCALEDAIENIDIGGPAMLRSAAKNYDRVAVITDVGDYQELLDAMAETDGKLDRDFRFRKSIKAFAAVAAYDAAISNYLSSRQGESFERGSAFPTYLTRQWVKVDDMRYGENPHQLAAYYRDGSVSGGLAVASQRQGKALSYNNVADADAAWDCVSAFDAQACVIVKHGNPCGVALDASLEQAYQKAFATDPTSAFGGIIAFNRMLDRATAEAIISQQFVEVILAPTIEEGVDVVIGKRKNVRLLTLDPTPDHGDPMLKTISGGLLMQSQDDRSVDEARLEVVTLRQPSDEETADLHFAWTVAKYVKSNAIVYAKDAQTIGVGAGQMSRVYSAKIAGIKAADEGLTVPGSVMASDAFFPFRDGIDAAAEAGIRAVIQPGGSVRDEEVIAAANEAGMAMIFTHMRHFRH